MNPEVVRALPQHELVKLDDSVLHALELATRKLGDVTQRQAAFYQRQADRLRKEITRRRRGDRGQK